MNQRFSLIMMICFLSLSSFSQFSIQWGSEQKGGYAGQDVIGYDGSNYFVATYSQPTNPLFPRTYKLSSYDSKMTEKLNVDFKLPKKEDRKISSFQLIGDKLIAFSTKKEDKMYSIYWQDVPKSSLVATGKAMKIADIPFEKKRDAGNIYTLTSDDGSKVAVVLENARDKDENARLSVVVLNSDMDILWSTEGIDLPYLEDKFGIDGGSVDNDGNVYIQGKRYAEGKMSLKKGNLEYTFHILQIKNGGASITDQQVKVEDVYLSSVKFTEHQGKMRLIGLYSTKKSVNAAGILTLSLDKATGQIAVLSKHEFDTDMFKEFLTEKQQKKVEKREEKGKDVEPFKYDIKNIVYGEDGSYKVVAEQWYTYTRTYTVSTGNGTQTRTVTVYVYNDIVVSKFNSDSKHEWSTAIHKKQASQDDGGYALGYALFVDGEDLYFIYNDHIKNTGKFDASKWVAYSPSAKNGVVVYTKVDANGEKVKKEMFTSKDVGMIAVPRVFAKISEDSMVAYMRRGRKSQFGVIKKK
jgi:uncharacterized protein YxeA